MDKTYNLTFKKNNVEKLLLNLDQNPYSQKNKDFRYTLSLIYELVEEEFADTFDTKNPILRQTKIDFVSEGNDIHIFITCGKPHSCTLGAHYLLDHIRSVFGNREKIVRFPDDVVLSKDLCAALCDAIIGIPDFAAAVLDAICPVNFFEIRLDGHDIFIYNMDIYKQHIFLQSQASSRWEILSMEWDSAVLLYDRTFHLSFTVVPYTGDATGYQVVFQITRN